MMNLVKGEAIRKNPQLKQSFFELAQETFHIQFEHWDALGYWKDTYCPYALEENGEIVANVSTSVGTLILDGRYYQVVQIGTVMTKKSHRNRGLAARLMDIVLEDVKHADFVYLFANDTVVDFYTKFGFEKRQQVSYRFDTAALNLQPTEIKKLDITDEKSRQLLYETMTHRMPVSLRLGMLQNEDIQMFHAVTHLKNNIYSAPKLNAFVVAEELEDRIVIMDVISKYPVNLFDMLKQLPIKQAIVELGFEPDISPIEFKQVLNFESGTMFVREQKDTPFPNHIAFPVTAMA